MQIENPKQDRATLTGRDAWFPYYAGFSTRFAQTLLASAHLRADAVVVDPWNGSATTTSAAQSLGLSAIGFDLNPVMVVAAKARSLSVREVNSLLPIGTDIIEKAQAMEFSIDPGDPLCVWFIPTSAEALRRIESAVQRLLIGSYVNGRLKDQGEIEALSDLAAFYYTALFRTARALMQRFFPTNPTWTKRPRNSHSRIRPNPALVYATFASNVQSMVSGVEQDYPRAVERTLRLSVASSENLPLGDNSADFVLTSPPYCTRIDYTVATLSELAVLGYHPDLQADELRRRMLGTSTVPAQAPTPNPEWGLGCNEFLQRVVDHPSKASATYYYKSHTQYFDGVYRSLSEVRRVLQRGGRCVIVVQDSYYKNIRNDLGRYIIEMMDGFGCPLIDRADFRAATVMANVHPTGRNYRASTVATESVLCFRKN